jgi:hypothetical protein
MSKTSYNEGRVRLGSAGEPLQKPKNLAAAKTQAIRALMGELPFNGLPTFLKTTDRRWRDKGGRSFASLDAIDPKPKRIRNYTPKKIVRLISWRTDDRSFVRVPRVNCLPIAGGWRWPSPSIARRLKAKGSVPAGG